MLLAGFDLSLVSTRYHGAMQAHASKQRNIGALWKDENFCSVLKDTPDNDHMSEIYELVGFCFELITTCLRRIIKRH